ncbi:phosphate/phosphite/phosphonate ABC transporter substrate-binding protein [Primorskyibacter sp. 2E107]|uniref:phosphate/phosphite/phosphonate ABC transporter substrate-binding protein n=1 Tax=Primorskyibacter sp. 2E107 TaxID=3403458 RepID=UPI003AF6FC95
MAALVALALGLRAGSAVAEPVYTFGVEPQFEARRLAAIWQPILSELEHRTGHRFRLVGTPHVPAFETAYARGDFDFAYMNPYHALVAGEADGTRAIIHDGGQQMSGVLVVKADSPYHAVGDLEGQTIAFPAPNDLGAALLMRADLDRIFSLHYDSSYVATHSSAYYNVLLGDAAAAGGVMATLTAHDELVRQNLRVIYETRGLPPHPVSVHPRVPDPVSQAVQAAFVSMAQTEEGAAMLARVPLVKAAKANQEQYQALRSLNLEGYLVTLPKTGG